jgi:ribosomal protein L18E
LRVARKIIAAGGNCIAIEQLAADRFKGSAG